LNKIFMYELRRLLVNKFFFGRLIVISLYAYSVLSGDIILGIANTAPFSAWSYGWFLSKMMPLLSVTLVFLITFFYTRKEKQVQKIINTMPTNPTRLMFLRCCAVIMGFVIIALVTIGISALFYIKIFRFTDFSTFLLPALLTLLPAMLFILGVGMLLGRLHIGTLYGLMGLLLLLERIPLIKHLDLFGSNFYQHFPLTISTMPGQEPAFIIPMFFVVERLIIALIGLGLVLGNILIKPQGTRRSA
jgi:hypothetical protein